MTFAHVVNLWCFRGFIHIRFCDFIDCLSCIGGGGGGFIEAWFARERLSAIAVCSFHDSSKMSCILRSWW
jgi:hypothetical protein